MGVQVYHEDVEIVASLTTHKGKEKKLPRRGVHKRRRCNPLFCIPQYKQRSNNRLVKNNYLALLNVCSGCHYIGMNYLCGSYVGVN
jgi:hypothetical protein